MSDPAYMGKPDTAGERREEARKQARGVIFFMILAGVFLTYIIAGGSESDPLAYTWGLPAIVGVLALRVLMQAWKRRLPSRERAYEQWLIDRGPVAELVINGQLLPAGEPVEMKGGGASGG